MLVNEIDRDNNANARYDNSDAYWTKTTDIIEVEL